MASLGSSSTGSFTFSTGSSIDCFCSSCFSREALYP